MSPLRSHGLRSDLMVLRGLSVVEEHLDRVVVRTPSEPDFWFGNMVIFRDDRIEPDAQIARFRKDFPTSRHVTIVWDAPALSNAPALERFTALGFEIDRSDVLTLEGLSNPAPVPPGIEIRPIETPEDWEQVIALQIETGIEAGHLPEIHAPFVRKRFANHRKQVAGGRGCWFGAFDGAQLVGDLGIFEGEGTARFQDVETRESHRRRGICAALVSVGLNWARRRAPASTPVIVAYTEGNAGRIYRRCGFTLSEQLLAVIRPPDGAKAT
ncbi:GNAT family N-acetyltransferase [Aliiruegeria lutimaris]|uniref:N-acetyltransferase domain-containing protein n=1 Tax=Aliiruegeria lutimaris TaxID=571298 RepID=A0A1G9CRK5_9RHOB|nr:GNAT family N-acetyltransferase [Aliiruegeria lutimaris]SDK54267.1 hypothetical protein SAMN04488026_104425 [Aliiruegeria lutimaris]